MKNMIDKDQLADLQLKWVRMQDAMRKMGVDGCLLAGGVNLFYATGRVFNGYFYMPAEGDPFFFIKRPNGLSGNNVEYIRKPEQITEILLNKGIRLPDSLLLEGDELSHSEYIRLESVFNSKTTGNATPVMRSLREIKTPWEISQFRISADKHSDTYSRIVSLYRPGMSDLELQLEIERLMRQNGSLGFFRVFGSNMDIFMGSILAGENAENPSPFDFALGGGGLDKSAPIGANGTLLREGTTVMVDMAGNYTPYITDMTRVFSIGKLPEEAYRAHNVSIEIQDAIMKIAKPGIPCAELYNISLEMADKAGLSANFMGTHQQAKFVGHGIGLQINELPVLTSRSLETLETDMVFALEPKFVLPGIGAVGIENSFLVSEKGLEKLTVFQEDIIPLD